MPEERKLVTVLFADVTGSTTLGEDLDPEDIRALMGRYYEHARRVVEAHGGTLEKFIGDAVMAVFGVPRAHGDDADRAVATALALMNSVKDDPLLTGITLRVGVDTGEVVATSDLSSRDFLVTGEAVNMAARLQQSAAPEELLVGERTYRATQSVFLFDQVRELDVKGKRERLRAYLVRGAREERKVGRPALVGRKRELAQLTLLHSSILDERRPQMVSIIAPAGTGKTRLLEEFLAELDSESGCRVAISRCLPYGQTMTYWPLRGLLEGLLGEIRRDHLVDAFQKGGLPDEDADRLGDLILATLGINSETPTEPAAIFSAWRLLMETVTRGSPCVAVFEDLHWASDSLLDLVEHIMQPRTQAPILIIATSRPELMDRRGSWGGGGRQNFTTLMLQPLNETHTAELVQRVGETLPEAVRERIVERSGGNPFFATELVRGVVERGTSEGGQVVDVVPDTVHAAVLARLDRLSGQERRVLQAAAAGGTSFHPSVLSVVLQDLARDELNTALDGLLQRDLIVPADEGGFAFHHILIRDVAYGTLSRAERIRMHTAVAHWLEDYAVNRLDEFAELIAYHYREALMLSRRSALPLPVPLDVSRAIYFLERAGELASRSGGFTAGRIHLESAIEIAPRDEQARLYEKLGDCAGWGDAALAAYEQTVRLWREPGSRDPAVGARLLRKILIIHMRWAGTAIERPSYDEMVLLRAEARRLAERSGDVDEQWRVQISDLFWPFWKHRTEGIDVTTQEAENGTKAAMAAAAHFEEKGNWLAYSEALDGYVAITEMIGRHDEALEATRRRVAAPGLSTIERGDALVVLVRGYEHLGQYESAITVMQEALTRLRAGEPTDYLDHAAARATHVAWINGRWGDIDTFLSLIEDVRRLQPYNRSWQRAYWVALWLAAAREDRLAIKESAATVKDLLKHEGEMERGFGLAWIEATIEDDAHLLDPDLLLKVHGGDAEVLANAVSFLSEHGVAVPAEVVTVLLEQAYPKKDIRAARVGTIAEAVASRSAAELEIAIDEAERHGLIPHAARMRIVLSELSNDPAPLEQARPVLERLGDRQFLRRLSELEAKAGLA